MMWSTKPARSGELPIVFGGSWTAFGSPGRARREQQVGQRPAGRVAARSVVDRRRIRRARRRRCRRRAAARRSTSVPATAATRRLACRRVDERQARARLGGDVRDLAGREVEVDRHRARLAERGGGVDEQRRRAIAGDRRAAVGRRRGRTPGAPRPIAACASANSDHVAPPWASDRIAQPSGSSSARASSGSGVIGRARSTR